jgi:hypothetical protein
LSNVSRVTFGSKAATIVHKIPSYVEVVQPVGVAGSTVVVTVTDPNGSATTSFTYDAAPVIAGVIVAFNQVVISGANFIDPPITVWFGSKEALGATVTVQSVTSILVTHLPPGVTLPTTVTVKTRNGASAAYTIG